MPRAVRVGGGVCGRGEVAGAAQAVAARERGGRGGRKAAVGVAERPLAATVGVTMTKSGRTEKSKVGGGCRRNRKRNSGADDDARAVVAGLEEEQPRAGRKSAWRGARTCRDGVPAVISK